jgi:hypothetical protein
MAGLKMNDYGTPHLVENPTGNNAGIFTTFWKDKYLRNSFLAIKSKFLRYLYPLVGVVTFQGCLFFREELS